MMKIKKTLTPQLLHTSKHWPSEQASQEPHLLQPGYCCLWEPPPESAPESSECLRGGKVLLGS